MKLPNCLKNLNSRKGNEKGSVTLFVLIAMLFFLMIGMMIFIINMNTETSQKRDVEKIKSEYNANTSETDLDQLYQEAKQRQIGTFMIKLIDKYGTIYNSGEWVNEKWLAEGRLPLTVQPNFPEGLKDISVTVKDDTYGGSTIITKTADLATMEIRADKDCQYTIENTLDNTNQVKINIDTTKPTIDELKGGTIWKGTEEEEITGTDAGGTVTITARDNLSGVKELKYIINNSPEAPSADAEWTTVEGATAQVTINNENDLGVYYIHAMATDVAGNVRDVVTSGPYEVKQANYKITTTTGTTYSETLKDAAEKPGAMVIKVLNTFTDEVPATIAQNVTIDTNGKTLTMAETITVAGGATTTFVGTGTIQRNVADGVRGDLITNNGTVVVGVENSDNGPTLTSKDVVINNGTVTVYSGNIASQGQSVFAPNAGIYSKTINVYGGNITNDSGAYGIVINLAGICNITGGRITGNKAICPQNGTLNISGSATIEGNAAIGSSASTNHNYTLNISGGVIRSTSRFAINADTPETNITITGGTITGATDGISITGANSTLTIGDNTNALNRESPVITGTNGKGINIAGATSTLNYYDGTIIGKTKGTKTFNGREVAFNVANDTTVNFLTETEEGNVTRYYRPYTRENTQTHLFETVLEKQVNVTFNPGEGATVAESNRNVLTNVEYKEKAEDATIVSLPTPEKTGYTFKGWNGKNLLNLAGRTEQYIGAWSNTAKRNFTGNGIYKGLASNNYYIQTNASYEINENTNTVKVTSYNDGYGVGFDVRVKPDTQYTLNNSDNNVRAALYKFDGTFTKSVTGSFTTTQDTYWLVIVVISNKGIENIASNIQLEQGSTATPYEPYYITDETKVVQDQDHTLNAIWEANEYTVHFNGDGSTAGTVEDQKFKYDEEKALNENKFERKYTVTYDGNEGTSAKTDDTATYTFANWINKTNNLTYQDKAVVKNLTSEPNGEVTLYAVWTPHEVTLPTATREGYIFNGWYDAKTGGNKIGNAGDKYIPEANTELHAQWRQVHYTVSVGEETLPAETLAEAVGLAEERITGAVTTATITPTMSYADSSTATISKNITLDLKGNTLTMSNTITNKGTLEIKDTATGGTITRAGDVITNNASTSIVTVKSGSITATNGIAIKNNSTGTINVSGGTISGGNGIYNNANGTINVSGATTSITGTTDQGIRGLSGNVTVSDGTITGATNGIAVRNDANNNSGSIIITGGTITGNQYGLYATGNATITLGNNDGTVSKISPEIISNATSSHAGVYTDGNTTFNFYDGKVVARDGWSLNTVNLNKPDHYQVVKRTDNGKETAVLEKEITVTFEPNPGNTTGGTVSEASRKVLTNVEYQYDAAAGTNRTLPTPTKTGYTFKGWQPADNLISTNPSDWQQGGLADVNGVEGDRTTRIRTDYIRVSPNTKYKLSVNNSNGIFIRYVWFYNNEKSYIDKIEEHHINNTEFTTPNDCYYIRTVLQYNNINGETDITPSNVTDANIYLTETVTDSTIVTQDQDHTLNAVWEANPYTVTLNAGDNGTIDAGDDGWARAGDNKTATKDITYDSNYGTLPTASRTGYTFEGWFTEATGGTQITDTTKMQTASAQTLYPHWTANNYTVTANANGGAIASTTGWSGTGESAIKQVTYDSAYGTLPEVTKTGYTFKGWNGKNLFELKENVDWKLGATTYNVNTSENSISIDTKGGWGLVQYYLPVLKANTTYTISGNVELINHTSTYVRISKERNKQNGNIFIFRNDTLSDGYFSSTFTIGENDETTASLCLYGNLGSNEETGAIFSNIQIEEGSTATPYEPYYITEDTKVTTASDHTLKAVWETIPYTISYELNKGTNNSSNPTGYTVESENITLQNPTRNGYTFIGWTGSNGDTPQTTVTIPKGSTGNRTYTANWEEKTYTLTIKPNGGAVDGSTTDVVRNLKYSDVSNINDPTRTGYLFGGYNELSGAAFSNELASITRYSNSNLTQITIARQEKSADNPISGMSNEVKITNAGTAQTQPGLGGFLHGKHADANKKYVHVFVAKLPEGYYFQNANNKLGDGATTQWLTSNEGTGNWQTYVYQVNAGSAGTFENFGYVYVSTDKDNDWRVRRAETGAYTAYLAYSNIYDITSDDSGIGQIDGTGVLTANWTATPYTVTLNAGDGTIDAGDDGWARAGDNKTATKDITYDSNYGTLPTASRTGYTFEGWFTEATGGTQITDTTKMQTASAQSLYAHWTANNYTIHFDANGGTGEMTDLPMTYGTPANLTANAFSRTGYKFVKWTSNADGTGNEYIDGQTVNNLTEINNDTVNLFAQWEERPFVVTFNPNGGIVTPESKEITYNSTYGDLPSGDNIKRLGYTFAGWYKEAELTNEVTSETTYDITEDSTLYAKWTPHVYTVTFNKNGGTGTMSDQSFTYGQTQNLRANTFTRTGYTFAGWARAENGTVEFTNEQSISNLTPENGGTITLYAVWNDVTRPSWSVRLLDIINK